MLVKEYITTHGFGKENDTICSICNMGGAMGEGGVNL